MKPLRKLTLALLKMGFTEDEVAQMNEAQAAGYLAAFNELRAGKSGASKTYAVKRAAEQKKPIGQSR